MSYRADARNPAQARTRVLELWSQLNRQGGADAALLFDWYYGAGPERPNQCVLLWSNPGESVASAVGACGLGRRSWLVQGERCEGRLLGDFVVDRAHRSLFPALILQRRVKQLAEAETAVPHGFPNDKARPVFARLGYREVGLLRRYAKVIDAAPHIGAYMNGARSVAVAAGLANGVLRGRDWFRLPPCARGFRVRVAGGIAADVGELANKAALRFDVLGARDAEFLRWRFVRRPGARCEVLRVEHPETGELCAHAIVERDEQTLHVRDAVAVQDVHWSALFHALTRHAQQQSAQTLSFALLADPPLYAVLARAGFVEREARRAFVWGSKGEAVPNRWLVTDADEDY